MSEKGMWKPEGCKSTHDCYGHLSQAHRAEFSHAEPKQPSLNRSLGVSIVGLSSAPAEHEDGHRRVASERASSIREVGQNNLF
jgi:hypothetical protein